MIYSTETEILIPFHDVDSMGIVWHGHYAKYFEVARCEFLDSFNYGYKAMDASGYSWPVVDMRIKYVQSLKFDQKVVVQCRLKEWEYRLKIEYVIVNENGEPLTKGHTVQFAIDQTTEEVCFETPAPFREALTRKLGRLV